MRITCHYTCDICHSCVHYPIPYSTSQGARYLCHSCMRYLSTAKLIRRDVS